MATNTTPPPGTRPLTEAEIVAGLATDAARRPELITLPGRHNSEDTVIAAVPSGYDLKSVEPYLAETRTAPIRRKGTAVLRGIDDFIALVRRFRSDDTALFAMPDMAHPSIQAVFDYHPETDETSDARWGQHRARYDFPLSPEWTRWLAKNEELMSQADFARHIEDNILDVIDPPVTMEESGEARQSLPDDAMQFLARAGGKCATAQQLIQLSRGLKVREKLDVAEEVNLQSGTGQLRWQAEHTNEAGSPLEVPSLFLLGIPVFEFGEMFRLPVRLRYRIISGKVAWGYEIWRVDRAFKFAFDKTVNLAKDETELPLFRGAPEMAAA